MGLEFESLLTLNTQHSWHCNPSWSGGLHCLGRKFSGAVLSKDKRYLWRFLAWPMSYVPCLQNNVHRILTVVSKIHWISNGSMIQMMLSPSLTTLLQQPKLKRPNSLKSWLLLEVRKNLCRWHSMANWRVMSETLYGKSEDGKSPSEQDWGETSQVHLGFIYCLWVYTCVH